ncbi:MAG: xanthine dehydrogenase family protein subunit M [Anaerolineales bacterium]|nr:xanthine dehydrogenase family protein subunit M [Chloroflexota bacterium]MBL6981852.1 xanthine dehydrogenase family protein subunit M [Anaerolineales bacterium]
MQDFEFLQPKSLAELSDLLAGSDTRLVAGGTDVIPKMRHNLFAASTLIDLSRVDDLNFIQEDEGEVKIGACVTHQQIAESELLALVNPSLVAASASVGCVQTRNRGTLGGNIANASPAADAVPPLFVYSAQVHLRDKDAQRAVPITEFFTGPGSTMLGSGEYIHHISFPRLKGAWGSAFQKMGKRSGMAIAVVSAAAAVVLDESGAVKDARIALGSVAPTVVRCLLAESILVNQEPTPELVKKAADACITDISTISDVRSTAEYRQHAAAVLAGRAIQQAVYQARMRLA